MAGTIKARRVQFLIGDIQMNGYLLPDGRKKLAGRNVTDAVDEPSNSLIRSAGVKSLNALPHAEIIQSISGESIVCISPYDAVTYWGAMATRGNERARVLLNNLRINPEVLGLTAEDIPVFVGNSKQKKSNPEKEIRNRLHNELTGEIEVICPSGRIDLLTPTEIIEIKELKNWKSAIGQVLVYGLHYPSHSKRIHLFGSAHTQVIDLIKESCHKLGILVTFEL